MIEFEIIHRNLLNSFNPIDNVSMGLFLKFYILQWKSLRHKLQGLQAKANKKIQKGLCYEHKDQVFNFFGYFRNH
jgi:hypothetical protein